ncbi:coilin-like [Impatiens glandulifera]|uniref:coilin-like n=1 Tax=Impatiens glandulifera TaxID=253017 RepID=UPI001FB06460|nr:coilin-like [Impatiens glandulifera]
MGTIRLRVSFEDRHILSKLQKSERLKRSWLLLSPQHKTISDVSYYLIEAFQLAHTCPNGIVLSMDGFVLPPFESVGILNDKDVISVKKKVFKASNIIKAGEPEWQLVLHNKDIMAKQPEPAAIPLLANEEFGKEAGGYESDSEMEGTRAEDALHVENPVEVEFSKKRKATESLPSASKKRKCNTITEDFETSKDYENGKIQTEMNISKDEEVPTVEISCKESIFIGAKSIKEQPSKRKKSVNHPGRKGTVIMKSRDLPDSTRKVSRSSRRKYAKRKFLKELREAENNIERSKVSKNEEQSPEKEMQKNPTEYQSFEKDKLKNPIKCHGPDHYSEVDGDIVPIIIRPGHIRFEPLEKDHIVQDNPIPLESFQWNGITSKEKGQKWGKEKFPAKRVIDSKDLNNRSSSDKESHLIEPMNFENLAPLSTLPQNGDLIAYRLLELSSTWTPMLSSFRVGKTSRCDAESNVVLLTPVSEYPIVEEKKADDDVSEQREDSLYKEDGSLEIDFSSLIDVRIFKPSNHDPAEAVNGRGSNDLDWNTLIPVNAATSDKKETNRWEEMSKTLSAKKSVWGSNTINSLGKPVGHYSGNPKSTHWGSRNINTTFGKSSWSSYKAFTGGAPPRPYHSFSKSRK